MSERARGAFGFFGALAVVGGLAVYEWPAAIIVAGLLCLAVAVRGKG